MRIYPFTEEYALYLRDESRSAGEAAWICFPVCEEDVREALSFAREKDLCVTTQGGRTGLAAGCVPHGGLILNLSRMDRVLGDEREGGAVLLRTQPGVLLTNLRKAVAALQPEYGALFFPPDPTETTASIGGMTACNASGARTYRYGATRKHVEGLRVILADGRSVTLRRGEQMAAGRCLRLRCDDGSLVFLSLPSYRMPSVKNASRKIGTFRMILPSHSGISKPKASPEIWRSTMDRPDTPPVTSPAGSYRYFVANAVRAAPNTMIT